MTAPDLADVRAALAERLPRHRAALEDLVRIPSVSSADGDPAEVRRAAEAVRDLLADSGLTDARLLEVEGSHPAVLATRCDAGPDAPTVLFYAHHDVQPTGPHEAWTSPPFEPDERDGRLYGRGAADDKAGVVANLAAVDAWLAARGGLPVNVKLFIEGEEETGSAHLEELLDAHGEALRADLVVVSDATNWAIGVPAITSVLRGLVDCVVEVRALDHAVHSGMYGGPVPDALTGLCRLLATMTDEHGAVAIPGFADDAAPVDAGERRRLADLDLDEARFRAEAGVLEGTTLTGDPDASIPERLWRQPTATVIGIDAPTVAASSNTLLPRARARLSLRLAPGQDPGHALDAVEEWVAAAAPWGLEVEVERGAVARSYVVDPEDPRHRPVFAAAEAALGEAYGTPVVYQGVGGTIPILEPFTRAFGGAPALLVGVEDPDTRAHGIDESLHLADWASACHALALLLGHLEGWRP